MHYERIHIDEEKNTLVWGFITVVAIAIAGFLLINAFFVGGLTVVKLVLFLVLISVAGFGIVRATSPVYHFELSIHDAALTIEISRSDEQIFDKQEIPLSNISELRIAPHTPRSQNEALFDFSTSYYLLYRDKRGDSYERLIYPDGKLFSFKVKDIRKIIGFLAAHNKDIHIPPDHELFMEQIQY